MGQNPQDSPRPRSKQIIEVGQLLQGHHAFSQQQICPGSYDTLYYVIRQELETRDLCKALKRL